MFEQLQAAGEEVLAEDVKEWKEKSAADPGYEMLMEGEIAEQVMHVCGC